MQDKFVEMLEDNKLPKSFAKKQMEEFVGGEINPGKMSIKEWNVTIGDNLTDNYIEVITENKDDAKELFKQLKKEDFRTYRVGYTSIIVEGRGRPKACDSDKEDAAKAGLRTLTFTAVVKLGKSKETETKTIKDAKAEDVDFLKKEWEKELHKKYNYDADDIDIDVKIGKYDASAKAEDQGSDEDSMDVEHSYRGKSKK